MEPLYVVGNISIDRTHYPDQRGGTHLGGAAFLVARAAARAGRAVLPVAVAGDDLGELPRVTGLDWSTVQRARGRTARFDLTYDAEGRLLDVAADYGVANGLTQHALNVIGTHQGARFHVCCRRPLDAAQVLAALTVWGVPFSVDFFLSSASEMIQATLPYLGGASTVFVNEAEHTLLISASGPSDLPEVVVTDGPRAARVLHRGRQVGSVIPPQAEAREVTGAGDTLAGTWLASRASATAEVSLALAVQAAAVHVTAPPLVIPAPRS